MLRSIFFKEWLKTRLVVVLSLLLSIGLCAYLLISTQRLIDANGMMAVWDTMLNRDVLFIDMLRFVPLIVGVLLGTTQILPEMTQKRIKLTLHLPIDNTKSIGAMVLYGAIVMLSLAVLDLGICTIVLAQWMPRELVVHVLFTAIVWYLAGLLAYFFTVWVALEPKWTIRVLEMLFAGVCLRGFFMSDVPEVYNTFLPIMAVFTLICSGLPLLSIERFKQGLN